MARLGLAGAVALSLLDEVLDTFGPEALEPALFYHHSPALRFELAGGETWVAQFLQAIDRARAIMEAAFAEADELTVIFWVWSEEPEQKLGRGLLAQLKLLGLQLEEPEFHRLPLRDGDDFPKACFVAELPTRCLPELLWGALARELDIKPKLGWRVVIAAPELGLLACPYDDRGMDITGTNTERLAKLYHQFDAWLLDYDRARMAEMLGRPSA